MNLFYTLHAQEQIKERKIEKVWVEETIKWPDSVSHIGNKYYAIRRINGKTVKVVYTKEKYIKIITSYFIK